MTSIDITGTETLASRMEQDMTKLIQDIDNIEKEKCIDIEQIKNQYTERMKSMDSEFNREIIKSEGKSRISIIMAQKALRAQKRRFQEILEAKKVEYEESGLTNRTTAATESFEKDEEEEVDGEGEDFGFLNNKKKHEIFINYEDEEGERGQSVRKDLEIMQDIIKDMNDIAQKRAQKGDIVMFDIEEKDVDDGLDDEIKSKKKNNKFTNMKASEKAQMYRIVAFSVISVIFTVLLILK